MWPERRSLPLYGRYEIYEALIAESDAFFSA